MGVMRKELRVSGFSVLILVVALSCVLPQALSGLERKGNLTLVILLDRSLSMEEEFEEVKDYIDGNLVEEVLIPGDTVSLFEFYRVPRHVFTKTVSTDADKEEISRRIRLIAADRAYTDIGKALDFLFESPYTPDFRKNRTHTLLLSDLVQEAPAESPYAGTRKNYSHPLLFPRKEFKNDGWRICIIGPTIEERAEQIAREVIAVRSQSE